MKKTFTYFIRRNKIEVKEERKKAKANSLNIAFSLDNLAAGCGAEIYVFKLHGKLL